MIDLKSNKIIESPPNNNNKNGDSPETTNAVKGSELAVP